MGKAEREGESGIAQGDDEHVHGEPEVIAQHRDEGIKTRRHGHGETADEKQAEEADR